MEKKEVKNILPIILLFASSQAFSQAPSKESVSELMKKTGAGEMGVQVVRQLAPALKQMIPEASEEFWKIFLSKVKADDMVDMVVPIYQRHLSQSDVDAIIRFYDTPAGKKLISATPMIMQESMAVGQAWGQKIGREALDEYQASKP